MAGRICIPIHNAKGELVAYAGRWPGEDVPDGQERYKLPPKFHKSRVLFNLHRLAGGEVNDREGYERDADEERYSEDEAPQRVPEHASGQSAMRGHSDM